MTSESSPEITAVPFGYKTAWFAIRSIDTQAIAHALEMQNVTSAGWETGVQQAYDLSSYAIFVSPPVQGWTLAVGTPFVFEADDHAPERMVELSAQFGEVQFFASMRTSSAFVWARAKDGRLIRHFYDADGMHREVGEQTEEEKALGFHFFDGSSPEANTPGSWERTDLTYVDEESVLRVAGRWSVDPSQLDQMGLGPASGLLGTPSASYPPKPEPIRPRKVGLMQKLFGK